MLLFNKISGTLARGIDRPRRCGSKGERAGDFEGEDGKFLVGDSLRRGDFCDFGVEIPSASAKGTFCAGISTSGGTWG